MIDGFFSQQGWGTAMGPATPQQQQNLFQNVPSQFSSLFGGSAPSPAPAPAPAPASAPTPAKLHPRHASGM